MVEDPNNATTNHSRTVVGAFGKGLESAYQNSAKAQQTTFMYKGKKYKSGEERYEPEYQEQEEFSERVFLPQIVSGQRIGKVSDGKGGFKMGAERVYNTSGGFSEKDSFSNYRAEGEAREYDLSNSSDVEYIKKIRQMGLKLSPQVDEYLKSKGF